MYAGREPASTWETRADAFKVATRSSADTGELKTVKLGLGKLLVFRSDLHIYTLSTRTLNPQLQWDSSVVCYCSSISVQFPAVNAAPSLVSIPDKSCQLSFPRSLCCLKIPPTSVFAKLVNKELSPRSC